MHPALSTYHNALSSISLFFLLDLLGASNPRVPSYFKTTHWAYQALSEIEVRARNLSLLQSKPPVNALNTKGIFLPDTERFHFGSAVQDDHIPFLARGVEVLHIIPTPFPRVWHELDDDGAHLDLPTVEDWAKLVTAFVGEWMDLEGYFPTLAQAQAKLDKVRRGGSVIPKASRKTEL
jgi:glutaminyl-peptide cyclotransferase